MRKKRKKEKPKKDETAPDRPKRMRFGWKDKDEAPILPETQAEPGGGFRNKEKVLVTCSRCVNYRYRHLMLNMVSLLLHCKKDNKVESKSSKGMALNELVELKGYSSALFFECWKHKDLYLWMSKYASGPSVKFLVNASVYS